MAPSISVIIPVYKVESWLDACVESVLAQTYQDLEIILVDDGSPDRCGAMCDAWAEKDARIQVVHKKNGGLSSARNAGLAVATGAYILFVDSDDVLDPRICEKLWNAIASSGSKLAICDAAHIFPEQAADYTVCDEIYAYSAPEAIRHMWYQHSFLPSAWAKLYHRDLFQDIRFTEGILYEDIDIMHLLFAAAGKVVYNPSALYGYNHREDSITTKPFSLRDLDILKIANKLVAYAEESDASLLPAAHCYSVVAALRVELNAPDTAELAQGHKDAQEILKKWGKQVLKDTAIRKKTKYGLMLYLYCRPLAKLIYKRINRWK